MPQSHACCHGFHWIAADVYCWACLYAYIYVTSHIIAVITYATLSSHRHIIISCWRQKARNIILLFIMLVIIIIAPQAPSYYAICMVIVIGCFRPLFTHYRRAVLSYAVRYHTAERCCAHCRYEMYIAAALWLVLVYNVIMFGGHERVRSHYHYYLPHTLHYYHAIVTLFHHYQPRDKLRHHRITITIVIVNGALLSLLSYDVGYYCCCYYFHYYYMYAAYFSLSLLLLSLLAPLFSYTLLVIFIAILIDYSDAIRYYGYIASAHYYALWQYTPHITPLAYA